MFLLNGEHGCTQKLRWLSNNFGVILDSRVQTLSQTLSEGVVNVGTTKGTYSFDATIGLILQTTSAHTFNLIFPNVGVGVYTFRFKRL